MPLYVYQYIYSSTSLYFFFFISLFLSLFFPLIISLFLYFFYLSFPSIASFSILSASYSLVFLFFPSFSCWHSQFFFPFSFLPFRNVSFFPLFLFLASHVLPSFDDFLFLCLLLILVYMKDPFRRPISLFTRFFTRLLLYLTYLSILSLCIGIWDPFSRHKTLRAEVRRSVLIPSHS